MCPMETGNRILVVDDDHEIRSLLADYLDAHGFSTVTAADGEQMHAALRNSPVDLIVLDLTLPGEDGLSLCRNLRSSSQVPVIMLTARSESFDRILGLEMGADDYLTKPFEPRELYARIRNVLRRTQATRTEQDDDPQVVQFAGWQLDLIGRQLIDGDGVVVALSGAEFRMLKIFVDHANRVLSRDQLLSMINGRQADPFDRSIDLQVSRLRQKLRDDARTPHIIKTVRNEGYVLATAVTARSPAARRH